ncbi:MAG: TolC family protein [Verrucomicrobiota bacterium]|nr:TolC family protein [Verrucomicrobiota bacterium]
MRKSFRSAILFAFAFATGSLTSLLAGPDNLELRNGGVPRFTLEEAVLTALQRNPDIQRARQEIERTKGVFLELRADAFPRVDGTSNFSQTDPHLENFTGDGGSGGGLDSGFETTIRDYNFRLQATQVIFAGGRVVSQIRSGQFQRDASYFAFRETIDTVIATVRQQFYQILLNRALIGVQEESVNLLQSQLQDQQNRFEAGTVPRFNVLQAQVALSNQQPDLISARNNYRIAQIQLARTIGLDFNPNRGDAPPLEAVGVLRMERRRMSLTRAIEIAKERRPFLKQQKANVLTNNAQVSIARSGFFPQISATGGSDFRSSPISENLNDVRSGYVFGATGSWAIWDWGQTYGRLKQAKALLEQSKITLDDAGRQVELEVQQAYSNLQQGAELIRSQQQNVGQAQEALRLASARLGAGAGTQLEVLNARVEVTRAQSTTLQALFTYNSAMAEFDRVTATEITFANALDEPRTREKLKTDPAPTPAPKPTPLRLNNAGNRSPAR